MRLLLEVQEYSPERFNHLPPAILRLVNPKASLLSSRQFKRYEHNVYELEELSNLPAYPGPKFVYAHLMITHPPYTFKPDGSMRSPGPTSVEGYNDQILYANSRMIKILQKIIEETSPSPVIILQGDHGNELDQERVKILNAFYLPEGGAQQLYPTVTPVNTFRIIFNHYFGEKLPLLPDTSYYSSNTLPYNFKAIPNNCTTSGN